MSLSKLIDKKEINEIYLCTNAKKEHIFHYFTDMFLTQKIDSVKINETV